MVEIQCRECKANIDVLNKRFKMCSDCSRNKKLNRCKTYKQRNKEKIKEYNKTWKEQNKKEVSEYNKNYAIQNKEQIRLRTNKHMKYKRDTDINYKMKITMRNRFRKFYLGKSISSKEVIGCSKDFFVKWIEFNFIGDMSWENHGSLWHIDHVLCCHLFDHTDENDVRICFNWQNTRPLFAKQNLSRKTFNFIELINHEIALHIFKKKNEVKKCLKFDFAYLTTKLLGKPFNGSS